MQNLGCIPASLLTPRAIVKALLPFDHQALEDKTKQEDVAEGRVQWSGLRGQHWA